MAGVLQLDHNNSPRAEICRWFRGQKFQIPFLRSGLAFNPGSFHVLASWDILH